MDNHPTQDFETFDEIDLKHLFNLLKRNFWLLVLGLGLTAILAFAFSKIQTPIYEAKTQVMVTRSSSSGPVTDVTQMLNTQQLSQTYVELLSQEWVRDAVAERLQYEISRDVVGISATANTQIITITIKDPNPAQARLVADTFVEVLLEQNESIQSGRYSDAEASIYQQISEMENQIAETQTELDNALNQAFGEQVAAVQKNIQMVQTNIAETEEALKHLNTFPSGEAVSLALLEEQQRLYESQLRLNQRVVEYNTLDERLNSESDPETIALLEAQKSEASNALLAAEALVTEIEAEIAWLSSLVDSIALTQEINSLQENLSTQRALLDSYKKTYTDLIASGKVENSTNEIDRLQKNIDLYQQIYIDLLNNRETIQLERMQNMPNIVQLNPAIATEEPVSPRVLLNTLLGGIAGLILIVAFILLRDFLDTSIKSSEEIEKTLGISVIGRVLHLDPEQNQAVGPFVVNQPRSPASEAFRSLRTNLDFMSIDEPLKSILVSSPGMSEGKTTVAANLAAIIAQSGKRVVIVDADLRRPRLHLEMNTPNRVGLSDVFRNRISLRDVTQQWGELNLFVIPCGEKPPNPAELLGSEKMNQFLTELEKEYDLVIIDSTPTIVTDSQLISARVDGVLLVLSVAKTDAEAARIAVDQYQRAGARILGGVMNNIDANGQGYGYTSYSRYEYEYGEVEQKAQGLSAFFANIKKSLGLDAGKKINILGIKRKFYLNNILLGGLSLVFAVAAIWGGMALSTPTAMPIPATPSTATMLPTQEMTATLPAPATPSSTPTTIAEPTPTVAEPTPMVAEPTPLPEVSIPTIVPAIAKQYQAGEVMVRPSDNMEMAYIPAGEFIMGNDNGEKNEAPAHSVYLDSYWIDLNEVTNRQYLLCIEAGACEEPNEGYFNYPSLAYYPVAFVSWDDANNYCTWVGGNLPTEAEWEKAARAPDNRIYPWGNDGFNCSVVNYDICLGNTSAVRHYPLGKSTYGLYDMAGNVAEWVADWYDENYYAASTPANPTGPLDGDFRVVRGGAWGDVNYHIRTTYRDFHAPQGIVNNIGFRCVSQTAP